MEKYKGYSVPDIISRDNWANVTAESMEEQACFISIINESIASMACPSGLSCIDCLFSNLGRGDDTRATLVEWLTEKGVISKRIRLEFELSK